MLRDNITTPAERFQAFKARNLSLSMTRGQPADENFDLSNSMMTAVTPAHHLTPSGIEIRNYPGGVTGLPEAKALFAPMLGVEPEEMLVGNNSSLMLMGVTLTWALLRGLNGVEIPWIKTNPRMIVTVPGYDRHFSLLQGLGFELETVPMTPDGPDLEAVKSHVQDPAVKGIFFVPVYSNPTGDTISDETVRALVELETAAPDFTIFADNAYAVHHLTEEKVKPLNLLRAAEAAGRPNRVYLYGSTSKITFASAGIGFMASSTENINYLARLIGLQTIGPNKVEQYRHVRFIQNYPGGLAGLMADHRAILRPKFDRVNAVLEEELGGSGLANWTRPKGGYFISLDTTLPVADRVVELAREAGVALTPAGATYPDKHDPHNKNIRLAPSRPPIDEVEMAMRVVAVCIRLASAEYAAQAEEAIN